MASIPSRALKTYNNIMYDIARDHNTIGTKAAENTDEWTLRDMVSEMQYTLDQYMDPDCIYWMDAHDECQGFSKPWLREWQNATRRMKRFIKTWERAAIMEQCAVNHCSDYDS